MDFDQVRPFGEVLRQCDQLQHGPAAVAELKAIVAAGASQEAVMAAVTTAVNHFGSLTSASSGAIDPRPVAGPYLTLLLSWLRSESIHEPRQFRLQVEKRIIEGLGKAWGFFPREIARLRAEDLAPLWRLLEFSGLLDYTVHHGEATEELEAAVVKVWVQLLSRGYHLMGLSAARALLDPNVGGAAEFRIDLWELVDRVCAWLVADPNNDDRLHIVESYLSPAMTPKTGTVLEHRFWGNFLGSYWLTPEPAERFLSDPVRFVLSGRTKGYSNRLLAAWLAYWSRSTLGNEWITVAFTPTEWVRTQDTWRKLEGMARAPAPNSLVT